jgi:hypothetical protein
MATNPLELLLEAIRAFLAPPQPPDDLRSRRGARDRVIAALAVYDYSVELADYDSQAQKTLDVLGKALTPPEDELREEHRLACLRIESNERAISEMTEANIAARKVIEDLRRQLAEANDALADMEGRVDEFAELDRRARATIVELERTIGRLSQRTTHVPEGYELVPEARASAYRAVAIHAERLVRSGLQADHLVALQGALDALNETLPPRDDA